MDFCPIVFGQKSIVCARLKCHYGEKVPHVLSSFLNSYPCAREYQRFPTPGMPDRSHLHRVVLFAWLWSDFGIIIPIGNRGNGSGKALSYRTFIQQRQCGNAKQISYIKMNWGWGVHMKTIRLFFESVLIWSVLFLVLFIFAVVGHESYGDTPLHDVTTAKHHVFCLSLCWTRAVWSPAYTSTDTFVYQKVKFSLICCCYSCASHGVRIIASSLEQQANILLSGRIISVILVIAVWMQRLAAHCRLDFAFTWTG
jgi:hypothetical protein